MILGQEQGSIFSTGGVSPNNIPALKNSKQHNEYSINGTPPIAGKPAPSQLDLNGGHGVEYISLPHL